jgi:F0F1-type ATP synthase epsilon subunit
VLYVRGGLLQVLDDVVNVIAEHAEGGTDET